MSAPALPQRGSETSSSAGFTSARSPSLSIVIVNWNGGEWLHRCVQSITQSPPGVPFDVIVVDNASSDGSPQRLRAAFEGSAYPGVALRVLQNAANEGFSRANNRAIAASGAPLLMLLNADAEVTPGALDTLLATLQADPRTGACGPRLVGADGALQPSAWRNPPSPLDILVSGAGVWRLVPRGLRARWLLGGHWDHATRRAVPMLFGTALMVKRAVIESVGALDERFHMYAEDNEWCLRMTRAGWQLVFEPAATVVHHGARFSLLRWGHSERLRVRLRAYFDFLRFCLPRRRVMANLAAGCAVAGLQRLWRTLRRHPAGEAAIVFDMHWAFLKRALREPAAPRQSALR